MTSRIMVLATAVSFCVCLLIGCGSKTSEDPKIKGGATETIPKMTPSGGGGAQQGKSSE